MERPESPHAMGTEPTVGELLRLREFREGLKRLGEAELREMRSLLAGQALARYPSALRWLARKTCRCASSELERERLGSQLVQELASRGSCKRRPWRTEGRYQPAA